MFILDWFYALLTLLGLLEHKRAKLVLLGLDNAGKTTLLKVLRDQRVGSEEPTLHPGSDVIQIGSSTLTVVDMGGHEAARRLWRDYLIDVSAIVFMVDAADRSRLPEARRELNGLLTDDSLQTVPMVVLGNKIDHPHACNDTEFRDALGLFETYGKDQITRRDDHARVLEVFMCSVVKQVGYQDGLRWVLHFI